MHPRSRSIRIQKRRAILFVVAGDFVSSPGWQDLYQCSLDRLFWSCSTKKRDPLSSVYIGLVGADHVKVHGESTGFDGGMSHFQYVVPLSEALGPLSPLGLRET